MAQVSIGQVDNLEDLVRDLQSVREALESSCREQMAVVARKYEETREERQGSESLLERAVRQEQAAKQAVDNALDALEDSQRTLGSAQSALSACLLQPSDEDGTVPDCSSEDVSVAEADAAVGQAQVHLTQASTTFDLATENRQAMAQRVDIARQAQAMAGQTLAQAQQECPARLAAVGRAVEVGTARLAVAQQALNTYLATHPPAAQFHAWLKWNPAQHGGPVTPNTLRDRMNLSAAQRRIFQEYLYDRNPSYRGLVDRYRDQWAVAKGDTERNIVARKVRIHLSGEFGEQMARHALAPLGARHDLLKPRQPVLNNR